MINFGDQLGQSLFCRDQFVYTYSGSEILILHKENMKVAQKIKVNSPIEIIAVNGDLFALTTTGMFLQYSLEGKLLQSKQHSNLQHPYFHKDHFICHNETHFLKISINCTKLREYSSSGVECIQYSEFKEQIVVADDKKIVILGKDSTQTLKVLPQTVNIIKLHEQEDLLACGLSNGKLVIMQYSTGRILQQDHWHAHPINCMIFAGTSLYTAGQEGVVVQWHLGVARKAFFPRQGGEIVGLCSDDDMLIVNIKDINQVKQISLMGQNQLCTFQGIHSVIPQTFLSYQGKLITPGVLGQLQVINPSQSCLIQTVPICQKNYSGISTQPIKQITILDRFLICALKSQLLFFENTHNLEFNLIASVDSSIDGIDASNKSVVTWGNEEVRIYRYLKRNNGQYNWNCIFRGDGYKGKNIVAASMVEESLVIVTSQTILTVNIGNNKIIKEVPLDEINPEAAYIDKNTILICNGRLITFYQDSKKIIGTTFGAVKSINKLSENNLALHYDDKYAIVVDIKQQQVVYAYEAKQLVSAVVAGRILLYSYHDYLYKYLTVLSTERKASMIAEEQDTAHFEPVENPDKPVLISDEPVDNNIYRRLQLAKQLRQIKELNLKEFLIPQSHMLPALSFLADRVADVLKQDFSEQKQQEQPSLELEVDQPIQQSTNNLEIQQLKKLFK